MLICEGRFFLLLVTNYRKAIGNTIGLSYQVIAILIGYVLPSDRGCLYQVIVDKPASAFMPWGKRRSRSGPTK